MAVVVSVQDFVVVVCIFGSAFLCDVACCEGGFGMVQGMSWRSPRIFVSGNVEFVLIATIAFPNLADAYRHHGGRSKAVLYSGYLLLT